MLFSSRFPPHVNLKLYSISLLSGATHRRGGVTPLGFSTIKKKCKADVTLDFCDLYYIS